MPWTVFAQGKAVKDSSIACLRHDMDGRTPEVRLRFC